MSKSDSFSRRTNRSVVTPFEVKGSLSIDGNKKSTVVLIWNISDSGLCIWSDSKLKKGEGVIFEIEHPWSETFECEVVWTRTVPVHSGYILGLRVSNNSDALAEIHKEILERQKKAG